VYKRRNQVTLVGSSLIEIVLMNNLGSNTSDDVESLLKKSFNVDSNRLFVVSQGIESFDPLMKKYI